MYNYTQKDTNVHECRKKTAERFNLELISGIFSSPDKNTVWKFLIY